MGAPNRIPSLKCQVRTAYLSILGPKSQKTRAISQHILIAVIQPTGDGTKAVIYRTPSSIASPKHASKTTYMQANFSKTDLITTRYSYILINFRNEYDVQIQTRETSNHSMSDASLSYRFRFFVGLATLGFVVQSWFCVCVFAWNNILVSSGCPIINRVRRRICSGSHRFHLQVYFKNQIRIIISSQLVLEWFHLFPVSL